MTQRSNRNLRSDAGTLSLVQLRMPGIHLFASRSHKSIEQIICLNTETLASRNFNPGSSLIFLTQRITKFNCTPWSERDHLIGEVRVAIGGFIVPKSAQGFDHRVLRFRLSCVDHVVNLGHIPKVRMVFFTMGSRDPAVASIRIAKEFPIAKIAPQQPELPHVIRNIFPDIANGTVGYVGKDIANHMWKFGLLGRDFGYRKFFRYPDARDCWISTTHGEKDHPHFGDVAEIYNVIDARQAEAQNTVIEALRGLGHDEAADRYTHFSYEMVALTPRCAVELGYTLSEEDQARSWIEVSGRKGLGVKADDLLDALVASAGKEVDARHPELNQAEQDSIATQVAIGALRHFMLKLTKTSVIAFDFKDALSFEGETGPYVQYAVVRASNIFRKGGFDPDQYEKDAANRPSSGEFAQYFRGEIGNDIWELWLAAAKTSYIVGQCIATAEPAYLAKHAFQLAQLFNTFYHRFPILSEADQGRKKFLLATTVVVRRELIRVLLAMGIGVPPVM